MLSLYQQFELLWWILTNTFAGPAYLLGVVSELIVFRYFFRDRSLSYLTIITIVANIISHFLGMFLSLSAIPVGSMEKAIRYLSEYFQETTVLAIIIAAAVVLGFIFIVALEYFAFRCLLFSSSHRPLVKAVVVANVASLALLFLSALFMENARLSELPKPFLYRGH